ncbi:MAG: mechanosensitive ion channel, partial [Bdellovibrionales bacterium]|nr:mechanosensitive ion channel [Bdellovibrionales bacterium]
MENVEHYLSLTVAGITLWNWAAAILTALAVVIAAAVVQKAVSSRLRTLGEKHSSKLLTFLGSLFEKTKLLLVFFIALWAGTTALELSAAATDRLSRLAILAIFLQLGLWLDAFVSYLASLKMEAARVSQTGRIAAYQVLKFIGRVFVWLLVFLLVLDNFGIDVTALIAGLGVGGIAVALAVQNILGDFLCSLSIIL